MWNIQLFSVFYLLFVTTRTLSKTVHFVEVEEEDEPHVFVTRGHTNHRSKRDLPPLYFVPKPIEQSVEYWNNKAQATLSFQLNKNRLNRNLAKNVIFFMGDGMALPTTAATRVYKGGEEIVLSFEEFPYTGMAKTYCANVQVADSSCSATAYLTGVKSNYETAGVSPAIMFDDCEGQNDTTNHVSSIMKWAQDAGMSTGFVTNTRVTHASPSGLYAHTVNRNWEDDTLVVSKSNKDPNTCKDIAYQLINSDVGKQFKVMMGGGRMHFLPKHVQDIDGINGTRGDNVNLIEEWKRFHTQSLHEFQYVENRDQLLNIKKSTEYLFGLFDTSHLPYNLESDHEKYPTLTEMVEKAVNILERNKKGYILFVEGGKIDLAHHLNRVELALDETLEFAKAVEYTKKRTNEANTLILVTADHSHAVTMSGYSSRGNNILGLTDGYLASDGLPYATISYANGPGYFQSIITENGERKLLKNEDLLKVDNVHPAMVPAIDETHGGEDVPVYASGPWAHLFTGVYEQNYIPHAIAYASCIGNGAVFCNEQN